MFPISALSGQGMDVLIQEIQTRVLKYTDIFQKRMKIPMSGPHYRYVSFIISNLYIKLMMYFLYIHNG